MTSRNGLFGLCLALLFDQVVACIFPGVPPAAPPVAPPPAPPAPSYPSYPSYPSPSYPSPSYPSPSYPSPSYSYPSPSFPAPAPAPAPAATFSAAAAPPPPPPPPQPLPLPLPLPLPTLPPTLPPPPPPPPPPAPTVDHCGTTTPEPGPLYPLPECYTDESNFMCCNNGLEDLMRTTYEQLRGQPEFLNCNVHRISSEVQTRAEAQYNTTFEVIVGIGDYASKSHFFHNLICKIERDGRYILTYATPKPEFEDTEAEGPLLQNGFFSGAHHTFEHANSAPSTFGGGTGGGSTAGGGIGGENAVGGVSGGSATGEGGSAAGGGIGGSSAGGGEYSPSGGTGGSATSDGGYSAYEDDTKPAAAEQYQPQPEQCVDSNTSCPAWAARGDFCGNDQHAHLHQQCRRSCRLC